MTSDELLKRLDKGVLRHKDGFVKFNQACRDMEEAAARIRELESELELYKSAGITREELDGLHFATHVIVPVEPTPEMCIAGSTAGTSGNLGPRVFDVPDCYRAMIRAAQPDASD